MLYDLARQKLLLFLCQFEFTMVLYSLPNCLSQWLHQYPGPMKMLFHHLEQQMFDFLHTKLKLFLFDFQKTILVVEVMTFTLVLKSQVQVNRDHFCPSNTKNCFLKLYLIRLTCYESCMSKTTWYLFYCYIERAKARLNIHTLCFFTDFFLLITKT